MTNPRPSSPSQPAITFLAGAIMGSLVTAATIVVFSLMREDED